MDLVSKKSDKVFDDTLTDVGGVTLFKTQEHPKLVKEFPWLTDSGNNHWAEIGPVFLDHKPGSVYIRFVDPCSERFGSIARLVRNSYSSYSYSGYGYNRFSQKPDAATELAEFMRSKHIHGELRWDGRNSKPSFSHYSDLVEYLPGWTGGTEWRFDRERKQRVQAKSAFDRLGREIQVGDFCTYILYQFDGRGAAGIYFGNVTSIDKEGRVTCKNVSLKTGERVAEKEIKDNNLITILTDDLMRQLMLAKLTNA
ncbi:hypothetical protein D3C72_258590 [compost metagenome]